MWKFWKVEQHIANTWKGVNRFKKTIYKIFGAQFQTKFRTEKREEVFQIYKNHLKLFIFVSMQVFNLRMYPFQKEFLIETIIE